jgi:amino acid transporter
MRRVAGDGQGGVEYAEAPHGYFERRGLRRYARTGSLWALGVGAVISGDFFGWNFGLAAGGFGGLLVATAIVTAMYVGLCLALVVGALLGYATALAIWWLGSKHPVGAVLLNMAVFGAVLSYVFQMTSYVLLRIRLPHIARPFRSPLGIPGALVALAIALGTLIALFVSDPVYRGVVVAAAVWYALGLLWFALVGRRRLLRSPEEDFALRAHGRE